MRRIEDDEIGPLLLALMFLLAGFLAVSAVVRSAPVTGDPFDPRSATPASIREEP